MWSMCLRRASRSALRVEALVKWRALYSVVWYAQTVDRCDQSALAKIDVPTPGADGSTLAAYEWTGRECPTCPSPHSAPSAFIPRSISIPCLDIRPD